MADEPPADKVVFPYRSMSQAVRDRYAKIGGVEKAFSLLKRGWSDSRIAQRYMRRRRLREKEEDAAFAAENKGRRFVANGR